jgi:hypothetical protein
MVAESRITVNPFRIPEDWPRGFAMVVARDSVAAVWGAQDPSGTIYLYEEHCSPHSEPSQNARDILAHGRWIHGLLHSANASTDAHRVVSLYQQHQLNVEPCMSVEDAALFEFWQLLSNNRLRVFAPLSMFLEEYRIGDVQSPLLVCAQALLSRRDIMRVEPKPEEVERYRYLTSPRGDSCSWMR